MRFQGRATRSPQLVFNKMTIHWMQILGGQLAGVVALVLCLLLASSSMVMVTAGGDCEVCIKVMEDVRATMTKVDIKQKDKVEQAIGSYCANTNNELGAREKKICYYIDPIKRDVAQPFSTNMSSERVCRRIEKNNPEICNVKFPVKAESLSTQDLSKLRVKQLKSILGDRGVECKGCIEKDEFIKMVEDTAHLEPDL